MPPQCPTCLNTSEALLAGEADGGWWFVCGECDEMWDERSRARDAASGSARASA